MPEMPEWDDVMTHHEDVNGAMSCETPCPSLQRYPYASLQDLKAAS